MKLLMISGDRSILQGKKGAFWYTLEELRKHAERIDVVCPKVKQMENGKWKMENTHPFENVWFHPSSYSLWRQSWWSLQKGSELIAAHRHDVMTVHEYPPFYNGLGARWLHNATGIPYMTEVHHIVGYPHAASVSELIGRWMSRLWLPRWGTSRAAKVRIVSGETEGRLLSWGIPQSKIALLPSLYLDHALLQPNSSIKKEHDVVFCARLVANKGLDDVLRAIADLPSVTLLVIGDGPERARSERLARSLGFGDRVTFRGWLNSNIEVYAALQSAKIFVMNSKSEGGPRVLFEAMALGIPAIATAVGLVPGFIDTVMVTTGTPDDLREKIRDLLGNEKKRESMGRQGMLVKNVFERGRLVKKYAEALKAIAVSSS